MKFYPRLIGLLGMLVAVPALAGIPDSPVVGRRCPLDSSAAFRRDQMNTVRSAVVVSFYEHA